MTATDPRELIGCACPRIDAGDCVDFRSGYDMRVALAAPGDPEYNVLSSGEACECACHEEYEASLINDGDDE